MLSRKSRFIVSPNTWQVYTSMRPYAISLSLGIILAALMEVFSENNGIIDDCAPTQLSVQKPEQLEKFKLLKLS